MRYLYGKQGQLHDLPLLIIVTMMYMQGNAAAAYLGSMCAQASALPHAQARTHLPTLAYSHGQTSRDLHVGHASWVTPLAACRPPTRRPQLLRPYHPDLPVIMAVMSTTNRMAVFPGIAEMRRQQAAYNTTNLLKVDMQVRPASAVCVCVGGAGAAGGGGMTCNTTNVLKAGMRAVCACACVCLCVCVRVCVRCGGPAPACTPVVQEACVHVCAPDLPRLRRPLPVPLPCAPQDYQFYAQFVPNFHNLANSIRNQDVHLTKNGSCYMGRDMAHVYAQSGLQGW